MFERTFLLRLGTFYYYTKVHLTCVSYVCRVRAWEDTMLVDKQIWKCVRGTATRVWGAAFATKEARDAAPLLYCLEHAGLCRHSYVGQSLETYIEFRQGEKVLDMPNGRG